MLTERQALQPVPESTCKMNTRLWVSNIRVCLPKQETPSDIDSISHIRYNLGTFLVRNGPNSHHTLTVWTESPKKATTQHSHLLRSGSLGLVCALRKPLMMRRL